MPSFHPGIHVWAMPCSPGDRHPGSRTTKQEDLERRAAIKATYDPRNLFRVSHNIPPVS
ncbi:MAG: BBE domain-containing protein [Chloroflexi bacterium]|nr:BBE domain-containing protein [Chloroflexota bacterium]